MKRILKFLFWVGVVLVVAIVVFVVAGNSWVKNVEREDSEVAKHCLGPTKTWPGYSELAKFSSKYTGQKFRLQGRIAQVIETYRGGVFNIRLDLGEYEENVVFLTNFPNDMSYGRPIEDELVDGYAVSTGDHTYTSVLRSSITIPELAWCGFN